MPKTKRDLLHALADRRGGKQGEQIHAALQKKTFFDDLMDRPIGEEEFALQLDQMERGVKTLRAKIKSGEWEKPGTWGFSN